VCPHTAIYVSSYYYMCPHTAYLASAYYYMCPHTAICVSSYYYICVLILLYVSSYYYYTCPHTAECATYSSPYSSMRYIQQYEDARYTAVRVYTAAEYVCRHEHTSHQARAATTCPHSTARYRSMRTRISYSSMRTHMSSGTRRHDLSAFSRER
jgi:hypothetical protein